MADPRIAKQIRRLVAEAKQRLRHSANRALDELSALAFSTVSDVYDESGAVIAPSDLPWDVAVAVRKIKRTEIVGSLDKETGRRKIVGHTIEIEMHDKLGPLRLLGEHYGLFVEQLKVLDKTEFAALLKESRERVSN